MLLRLKNILAVAAITATALTGRGAVTVKASLDSVNLLMGNITTLGIEVVENDGTKGILEVFRNADPTKGYVGVCGDSIELRTAYKVDTLRIGSGRIQVNYRIPVQAFDSGTYRLPSFVYVSEGDTAWSNELTLNVYPVAVTAQDQIDGFATVAEPEGKWTDFLPDSPNSYWFLAIMALIAIAAVAWDYMHSAKSKEEVRTLRRKPPYEEASEALKDLKKRNLWENGKEKEYFTRLTDILRIYLERRFGINAMEMTTREILAQLSEPELKGKRDYVRQILTVADFVKFAKVRPLPDDNISAYENAVRFVEETKPSEDSAVEGDAAKEKSSVNGQTASVKGGES